MSVSIYKVSGVLAGILLIHSTLSAQPPGDNAANDKSRQERIQEHQARIRNIIEESRKRREAQNTGVPPSAQAPPAPGTPANAAAGAPAGGTPVNNAAGLAGRPGQPLPTGPVQNARMAPPVQKAQPTPATQAPQTARSESRTILMFHPIDSIVEVGERFKTDVVAETKEGEIDEISFLVRFPRHKLNPLALDHSSLDKFAAGKIDYEFDPDKGTIYLHAKLKKPTRFAEKAITSLIWEALEPTDGSVISYEFGENKTTGLYLRGSNLLGTLPGAEDGVIRTTVQVIAPKSDATVTKLADKGLLIGAAPQRSRDDRPLEEIKLSLSSNATSVKIGQTFDVDVIVSNPGDKLIDRVQLYLQFDPEELQVVDNDLGNVVTRGINIKDGPYQENFPFDYSRYNYADNTQGNVIYDVSASNSRVRGNGVLATIKVKALKDSPKADIVLVQNAAGLSPTTDVSFLGESQIKVSPADRAKALTGAYVSVAGVQQATAKPVSEPGEEYSPFESSLAQRMRNRSN